MKMEPKGRIPPRATIIDGSINHFFSGMGRGTALTRHGKSGWPDKFRPNTVPTNVKGKIMKIQMQVMATYVKEN